jgi:hypothetical protein
MTSNLYDCMVTEPNVGAYAEIRALEEAERKAKREYYRACSDGKNAVELLCDKVPTSRIFMLIYNIRKTTKLNETEGCAFDFFLGKTLSTVAGSGAIPDQMNMVQAVKTARAKIFATAAEHARARKLVLDTFIIDEPELYPEPCAEFIPSEMLRLRRDELEDEFACKRANAYDAVNRLYGAVPEVEHILKKTDISETTPIDYEVWGCVMLFDYLLKVLQHHHRIKCLDRIVLGVFEDVKKCRADILSIVNDIKKVDLFIAKEKEAWYECDHAPPPRDDLFV